MLHCGVSVVHLKVSLSSALQMADQSETAEHEQTSSLQSTLKQDSSVLKSNELDDVHMKQIPETLEPPDKEKVMQFSSLQRQDRDTSRHKHISPGTPAVRHIK